MKNLKKFFVKFLTYTFYPIAFFLVIIIRLISPIILIRWQCTFSTRIGHYTENLNIYLCEKELGYNEIEKKTIDIFYDRERICNLQLQKMFHKKLFFLPWFIMHPINTINEYWFDKIFNSNRRHELGYYRKLNKLENYLIPPLSSFDTLNAQDDAKIQLQFNQSEINIGNKILNKMGLNPGEGYVTLILRNQNYLRDTYKGINYTHHSHRDTNIKFFESTIQYLTKNENKVIIMGVNKEEISSKNLLNNKNVTIYNESSFRSDFMDIFILSKSKFVISSITGLDSVPFIFKIPIIEVGVIPFVYQRTYSNLYISLFKNYFSKTLNRCLTMSEIFENDISHILGDNNLKNEIEFIHPSSDEILSSCVEIENRISDTYIENDQNKENQKIFRDKYNSFIKKYYPSREVSKNKGIVAEKFLKNNHFLLS